MARLMIEAISMRYEFSKEERGDLGAELAQVYQERAKLDEDRKSMGAQLKEREAGMENRIGTLSRQITAGHEMRTYDCTLRWDSPNVGEVSYYNSATGEFVKTRAMTSAERQLDLPLQTEEQTNHNVLSFFKKGGEVVDGGKETPAEAVQDGTPTSEDLDHHEADASAAGATAAPEQATSEPPPDFQGSLEEYHAQQGTESLPEPTNPKRPRKKKD